MFGTDSVRRAAHGSESPESAAEELAFFFGSNSSSKTLGSTGVSYSSTAGDYSRRGASSSRANTSSSMCGRAAAQAQTCCQCCGTTLGLILPHAVKDGVAGLMLEEIQAAPFQVAGLQLFNLPKQAAAEFLEVSQ